MCHSFKLSRHSRGTGTQTADCSLTFLRHWGYWYNLKLNKIYWFKTFETDKATSLQQFNKNIYYPTITL